MAPVGYRRYYQNFGDQYISSLKLLRCLHLPSCVERISNEREFDSQAVHKVEDSAVSGRFTYLTTVVLKTMVRGAHLEGNRVYVCMYNNSDSMHELPTRSTPPFLTFPF
jgi:hypothetical protein